MQSCNEDPHFIIQLCFYCQCTFAAAKKLCCILKCSIVEIVQKPVFSFIEKNKLNQSHLYLDHYRNYASMLNQLFFMQAGNDCLLLLMCFFQNSMSNYMLPMKNVFNTMHKSHKTLEYLQLTCDKTHNDKIFLKSLTISAPLRHNTQSLILIIKYLVLVAHESQTIT